MMYFRGWISILLNIVSALKKKIYNNFFKILISLTTIVIAVSQSYIAYQQYKVQKISSEPFFNIQIDGIYNESMGKYTSEKMIIHNDGDHARNIKIELYSFYEIQTYNNEGIKKFLIPATFFNITYKGHNYKGVIETKYGHMNRFNLVNLDKELASYNMSIFPMSIFPIDFLSIFYENRYGENNVIYFHNKSTIKELPYFIVESKKNYTVATL